MQRYNPNFMFRQDEIARILDSIHQGQSVLLTGIRRTGKTEVLREVLYLLSKEGPVGFLDVQDYVSLDKFYRDLLRLMPQSVGQKLIGKLSHLHLIPDRLLDWFRFNFKKVGIEGAEIEFNPRDNALTRYWEVLVEQLAEVIQTFPKEEIPVVGIDELPFMLENLLQRNVPSADLTVMLSGLRKLRDAGMRFIIAGSVSMENLLTLNQIPHTVLGGLWREQIPPYSYVEAKAYLQNRLNGKFAGSEAVLEPVLSAVSDYVPEFLNICARYLSLCSSVAACETAMTAQVLPAIRRSFLHQFDERLSKNYSEEEEIIAQRILDTIAQGDDQGSRIDGNQLPAGYRDVLVKLQYDNFIIDGPDFSMRFSLQLLRQWWSANRGIR